jgi:hypothetical protein
VTAAKPAEKTKVIPAVYYQKVDAQPMGQVVARARNQLRANPVISTSVGTTHVGSAANPGLLGMAYAAATAPVPLPALAVPPASGSPAPPATQIVIEAPKPAVNATQPALIPLPASQLMPAVPAQPSTSPTTQPAVPRPTSMPPVTSAQPVVPRPTSMPPLTSTQPPLPPVPTAPSTRTVIRVTATSNDTSRVETVAIPTQPPPPAIHVKPSVPAAPPLNVAPPPPPVPAAPPLKVAPPPPPAVAQAPVPLAPAVDSVPRPSPLPSMSMNVVTPPVSPSHAAPPPNSPHAAADASAQAGRWVAVLRSAPDPEARDWAATRLQGVSWMGHPEVVEALVNGAMKDSAPGVRLACIHTLDHMDAHTTGVLSALDSLLADRDPGVRQAAEDTLRAMMLRHRH